MAKEIEEQKQSILDNILSQEDKDEIAGGENEELDTGDDIEGDETDEETHHEENEDEDDPEPAKQPATASVADQPLDKKKLGFKADKAGNLVDKDGKVVFAAGRPRALYEKVKTALYQSDKDKQELTQTLTGVISSAKQLMSRYKQLKEQKNYPQSLGLTDDEIKQASEIMAQMKLDPKAGVRKVLTILHMNGTDLSDLGVTGPLDPKEVARQTLALQEANKPKAKTPQEEARAEAIAFFNRHSDAEPHVGMITEAKRRFPHMTLDQIWFQIKLAAATASVGKQSRKPAGKPDRVIPRNSQRNGKLSLRSVDPSKSFSDIGKELLRDLQNIEAS